MAGRFTNTTYTNTVDSLVKASKGVLNNPYYVFTDKKPTKVTYYKQNLEKSTLDPGSNLNYAHLGQESPIKFNKILEFFLYGIDHIEVDNDIGDFGLESAPVEGEAVLPPNVIIPTMGDFFSISYLGEDILFKVNNVNNDTLDNGSNLYKINYKLEYTESRAEIEKQVTKTFHCVVNTIGSDFKCIIEETSYQLISILEDTLSEMVDAYQIFFNGKVQNFVYKMNGFYFYDSYLIEFMIKNKIMSYGSSYIYVHHDTSIPKTFAYDYTKTIFYVLEHPNELPTRKIRNTASAILVSDINSLMTTYMDRFFEMNYTDSNQYNSRMEIIPFEILERCKSGELYLDTDPVEKRVYNLMIAYFSNKYDYMESNVIDLIRQLDYVENKEFYYLIPINIFIIRQFILYLMSKK